LELFGKEYLQFLQEIEGDCLKQLIDFLSQNMETKKKDGKDSGVIVPQKWLEAKIQRIRKIAIESDKTISGSKDKITAKLFSDKK
jgi:hypothetical protein